MSDGSHGEGAEPFRLPRRARIAVIVAAVLLAVVLLTSVDLTGDGDAPPASRTFTGFDTVPTTTVTTTAVTTTGAPVTSR